MAGGWTRDGAVQDQIDDTVKDAILRARALTPQGESAEECDDCGEPIPKKRREALPGRRPGRGNEVDDLLSGGQSGGRFAGHVAALNAPSAAGYPSSPYD